MVRIGLGNVEGRQEVEEGWGGGGKPTVPQTQQYMTVVYLATLTLCALPP